MDIKELPLKKPKQKRRHAQSEAQKAQQAKFLKRGYHGQKAGRPRQQGEVVARIRASADEILDILFGLLRKEHLTPGDKIRSLICEALLDRGFGRAPHTLAAAIQHTSLDGTALHLEGAAMSPLLQAAHAYAADEAKQLQPPDAMKAIDVVAEPISSQSSQSLPEVIAMPPPAPAVEPATAAAVEAAPAPEKPPEPAQEAPKCPSKNFLSHRNRL